MDQMRTRINKVVSILAAGALIFAVVAASGAVTGGKAEAAASSVDYFLKIDGIAGESTDAQHAGEIDLKSFAWSKDGKPGLEQQGTTTGGGGGAGKVSVNDIHFTHSVSKASPQLMQACATGKHIKEATLSVRKAGKEQVQFMTVKLQDVQVSSYRTTGETGNLPADEFSLSFAKIEYSFSTQKADGSLDAPVIGNFDFKAGSSL